jgi:hypothetical protein
MIVPGNGATESSPKRLSYLLSQRMMDQRPQVTLFSFCLLVMFLFGLPQYIKSLNVLLPHLGLMHRTLAATVLLFPLVILVGTTFPVRLSWLREINRQGVVIAYSIDVLGAIIGIVLSLVIPIWFND